MDQVRCQILTRIVAVIDVIYNLAFLLLYAVIFIDGSVIQNVSVKEESSDNAKVFYNGTHISFNTTKENGGKSRGASSDDVFGHLQSSIGFAVLCLLLVVQLWTAVNLLLSTRQGQNEAPEISLRMARLWRNIHVVVLVILALGFVLGYHWLDLLIYALEPVVVVTIASMFCHQLDTFLKLPV